MGGGVDIGKAHHDGDTAAALSASDPAISMDGDSTAGDPAIVMETAPIVLGESGSESEASDPAKLFRRSRRVRRPNPRLRYFQVELPASLVVRGINTVMEQRTVQQAWM